MKKYYLLIITLLSTIFISCATKDSDKKEENSIKNEVTGIYSNDTTAILVTDRNQNITIFRAINKYTLISHKNSIFYKKK